MSRLVKVTLVDQLLGLPELNGRWVKDPLWHNRRKPRGHHCHIVVLLYPCACVPVAGIQVMVAKVPGCSLWSGEQRHSNVITRVSCVQMAAAAALVPSCKGHRTSRSSISKGNLDLEHGLPRVVARCLPGLNSGNKATSLAGGARQNDLSGYGLVIVSARKQNPIIDQKTPNH